MGVMTMKLFNNVFTTVSSTMTSDPTFSSFGVINAVSLGALVINKLTATGVSN